MRWDEVSTRKLNTKAWQFNLKFNLCFQDIIRTSLLCNHPNDPQCDKKGNEYHVSDMAN